MPRLSRRRFVASCLAACVPTFVQARQPIRLAVRGAGGRDGFDLALDEMARTVALLGRELHLNAGEHALQIDLDTGALVVNGEELFVSADDTARQAAVRAWRRDHDAHAHVALEWHASLEKYGAGQLNGRFSRRFGRPMGAADWIGWMLVKIAVDSGLRGVPVEQGRFDGHKGAALMFGRDRRLVQPLCIVDRDGRLLGVTGCVRRSGDADVRARV